MSNTIYTYSVRARRDVHGRVSGWYLCRTAIYGGNTEYLDIYPSRAAARVAINEL